MPLPAFNAAKLFSPSEFMKTSTAADLDQLKAFPFLDATTLPRLKLEPPSYLAKASQVNSAADFKI